MAANSSIYSYKTSISPPTGIKYKAMKPKTEVQSVRQGGVKPNKGNHRWEDNICIHCGCKRTKKTFKYLMAITNHPPYDHYMYEQGYVYETGEQTTRERPFCPGRSSSR